MTKPTLYLFVGYPGAGKTTVARYIHELTGAAHIWADKERDSQFGKPRLSVPELAEFYNRLNNHTEQLLAAGHSVVFDTNFNFRKDREHLQSLASNHGAETVIIWLDTPVEIARLRAVEDSYGKSTRVWGNMSLDDFQRLSNKLEAPTANEHAVLINGSDVSKADIQKQLGL